MANLQATLERLRAHVPGTHSLDEPLAARTSIRVGGKADLFVQPADGAALARALLILQEDGVAWHLLGGGANTLIGDAGFRGAVIRLPNAPPEELVVGPEGVTVTLAAGAPIVKLVNVMKKNRATGAEFMVGIPGTIGGAVAMNAGTKNGWIQYCLRSVELVSAAGLEVRERDDLHFAYRFTKLPPGSVVWRATCFLPFGDVERSEQKMADDLGYRRSTQPLHLPNFGSCFVNPPNGSAGKLIEQVGLKGHRIGNAQISDMHANFIVNLGGARASEVRALLTLAHDRVHEQTGIDLHHEVKFVGEFEA